MDNLIEIADNNSNSMIDLNNSEIETDRRVWTKEEDDAIRELVTEYGTKSWSLIAEHIQKKYKIGGRSGKQCRERWHNHLGNF